MDKPLINKIIVAVSLLATIVVNALANILPFNGITTGEVSDSLPIYFVPAPYVFGIWILIYAALIAYVVYTFIKYEDFDKDITWLFVISNIANAVWMFMWHYQIYWASVILMLVILVCLILIYTKKSKEKVTIFKRAPFSIYLGWISVATIANISGFLYSINWDGFGVSEQSWATILVAIATVLTILMLRFKKDILYSLVIIWALIGIMYNFLTTSDLIVGGIIVSLAVLLTEVLFVAYQKN